MHRTGEANCGYLQRPTPRRADPGVRWHWEWMAQ